MPFGKKIGPTGRKRDEFEMFALNKQGHEINKPYRGTTGYEAYGREGVKEAKHSVHRKFPHRWIKFSIHNMSALHRKVAKRRAEAAKNRKQRNVSYK